jgi:hypothetical protein
MSEQAIIIKQSSVTPWASREDVRELGNRIRELMPGGQKLQPHEALALAQAAVAHNLDPFNGELWFIPGRGLMAGIKGHRRAAHRQINEEGGGNYWTEFIGPLNVDEKASLQIPTDALAFRCRIFDSRNIGTYTASIEKMLKAGMPWEVVSRIMGERPYTEGIGYLGKNESTKMSPVQCAQKRAEADALKRRFDLPFTVAIGVNGDSETTQGEFIIEHDPVETQAKRRVGSRSLYGDDPGGDIAPPIVNMAEVPEIPSSQETGQELGPHRNERESSQEQSDAQPAPVLPPTLPTTDAPVKNAALKYQPFVTWCNEWVRTDARAAKYAKEQGGQANMYHILGRVTKLGFTEVTAMNVELVEAKLQEHVA